MSTRFVSTVVDVVRMTREAFDHLAPCLDDAKDFIPDGTSTVYLEPRTRAVNARGDEDARARKIKPAIDGDAADRPANRVGRKNIMPKQRFCHSHGCMGSHHSRLWETRA